MKIIDINSLWNAREEGHQAVNMGYGDDANPYDKTDPKYHAWLVGYWNHWEHSAYTEFGVNYQTEALARNAFRMVVEMTGVELSHFN